jgi:uncharacterized OB-fold protein
METNMLEDGVVYTETVVYSAPEAFLQDAPYQLAIIEFSDAHRVTGRILGGRVGIGDRVSFVEYRQGIPCFQKTV